MFEFLKKLIDFIYKKRCYFCNSSKENTVMCNECYKKICLLPHKVLKKENGIPVYSASVYDGNMTKLIRGVKYHSQKELAYYQAKVMYDFWKNISQAQEDFLIIPVPIHNARKRQRGYNHMDIVALEFSKFTNYDVQPDLLKRIKKTKPQYSLSKKEREENLKGAFEINQDILEKCKNRKILILDDIITTGSTIYEITNVLKNAGFKEICAFTTSCSKFYATD